MLRTTATLVSQGVGLYQSLLQQSATGDCHSEVDDLNWQDFENGIRASSNSGTIDRDSAATLSMIANNVISLMKSRKRLEESLAHEVSDLSKSLRDFGLDDHRRGTSMSTDLADVQMDYRSVSDRTITPTAIEHPSETVDRQRPNTSQPPLHHHHLNPSNPLPNQQQPPSSPTTRPQTQSANTS